MRLWSERISTLAEVLAPWPAPAEPPATLSEVYLGLASAYQYGKLGRRLSARRWDILRINCVDHLIGLNASKCAEKRLGRFLRFEAFTGRYEILRGWMKRRTVQLDFHKQAVLYDESWRLVRRGSGLWWKTVFSWLGDLETICGASCLGGCSICQTPRWRRRFAISPSTSGIANVDIRAIKCASFSTTTVTHTLKFQLFL